MVTSSSVCGRLGQSDVQDAEWSLRVAESDENPRFRPLPEPLMVMSRTFLKASLW
jgi:hypothetical protein